MDHRIFWFATRGQCIKGKKARLFWTQPRIFFNCNVLALLSFYALPSGGNRKTWWSIEGQIFPIHFEIFRYNLVIKVCFWLWLVVAKPGTTQLRSYRTDHWTSTIPAAPRALPCRWWPCRPVRWWLYRRTCRPCGIRRLSPSCTPSRWPSRSRSPPRFRTWNTNHGHWKHS